MYRLLFVICCCLPTVSILQAQTSDPETARVLEQPGEYSWTHDLQVILGLVGMPESEVCYEDWVRDLDPEFNDWSSPTHAAELRKYGIRSSVKPGPYQELKPAKEELVQRFLGDGVCAFFNGKPALGQIAWGSIYFLCHNNPAWHTYKKQETLNLLPQAGGINQDNLGTPWKGRIGFCEECQRYFRTFLRQRFTAEDIRSMGIRNLDRFTIMKYLEEKYKINPQRIGGTPGDPSFRSTPDTDSTGGLGSHLVNDPVVRQYVLAMSISQQDHWRDIVEAVHGMESQLGRSIPCAGNQYGGDEWADPYELLLSQENDIISFESDPWSDVYVTPRPITKGATFKLALASGRYEKAVWTRGGLYDRWRKAEDGHSFRMRLYGQVFQDLAHGEAFANGGIRVFNLANEGGPPPEPDYELRRPFYQRFIDYARFIHGHRAALQDRENAAEVALVYSMPTQFWEYYSPLGISSSEAFARFSGWARLLEEVHTPYEVVIFGHSELFPDGHMLDRLSRYRVVILPGVTGMTETQADAIRRYVQNGGSVVWSGDIATHDEDRNLRPESLLADFPRINRQHVGQGRIVGILDEDKQFRESIRVQESPNPTDFHVMREALMWGLDGCPQIVTTACPETQCNLWIADNKRSASLHLVNYNVDIMRDYVEPQRNLRFTVRLPEGLEPVDRVTFCAPGEDDLDLQFTKEGRHISFRIPEMRVWAMVVFSSGQEQAAATALANARKQIRKHSVMQHGRLQDWIQRYEQAFALYQHREYAQALTQTTALVNDATPRVK
jgi:hypothetical protein